MKARIKARRVRLAAERSATKGATSKPKKAK
jgi:hypothetical protein